MPNIGQRAVGCGHREAGRPLDGRTKSTPRALTDYRLRVRFDVCGNAVCPRGRGPSDRYRCRRYNNRGNSRIGKRARWLQEDRRHGGAQSGTNRVGASLLSSQFVWTVPVTAACSRFARTVAICGEPADYAVGCGCTVVAIASQLRNCAEYRLFPAPCQIQ